MKKTAPLRARFEVGRIRFAAKGAKHHTHSSWMIVYKNGIISFRSAHGGS
jgi:hypothetical protein